MADQLMSESLDLLVYGMGTVIGFLILLVGATVLMSRVISRFFPAPVSAVEDGSAGIDPLTLRIIQAAVHRHRGRNRGN